MKGIKRYKWSWLMLVVILLLYVYFVGFDCIFLRTFHVICPGCGMTRAIRAVLHMDLYGALMYHPMVFALPLVGIYVLKEGRAFKNKYVNISVISLVGVGFLVNYIFKLIDFL